MAAFNDHLSRTLLLQCKTWAQTETSMMPADTRLPGAVPRCCRTGCLWKQHQPAHLHSFWFEAQCPACSNEDEIFKIGILLIMKSCCDMSFHIALYGEKNPRKRHMRNRVLCDVCGEKNVFLNQSHSWLCSVSLLLLLLMYYICLTVRHNYLHTIVKVLTVIMKHVDQNV